MPRNTKAFTLIELLIAIGILGLGLTMVAAIFPAALKQHRISTDRILAADVIQRAQTIMRNTSVTLPAEPELWTFADRKAYAYPYEVVAGNSDFANNYIRPLNEGNTLGSPIVWDDVLYPPLGKETLDRRRRYTWISFARNTQGIIQYTVFVCRRIGGQRFALQDYRQLPDLGVADQDSDVLLPTPWKIALTVRWFNIEPDPDKPPIWKWWFLLQGDRHNLSLEELIRPGSKLLSQHRGRIYTVLTVNDGDNKICVLEHPFSECPDWGSLNVWLIPGPVDLTRRTFGRSPVVDVLCFAGP